MNFFLLKSSFRYFKHHIFQTFLSIIGIALGIAVSTGIDITNTSTLNAFKYSMNAVTGKAFGHIVSLSSGIDSNFYFKLRNSGYQKISPVVELPVKSKDYTYIVFGTDPFAWKGTENRFSDISYFKDKSIASLIAEPGSVIISWKIAKDLDLDNGDNFSVSTGKTQKPLRVVGIINKTQTQLTYDHIILTDIATAQELWGYYDKISRIDLFDKADFENISKILKPDMQIISSKSRSSVTQQMVESFQINLSALSLLALIVGFYLIYNTIGFSVVRRKTTLNIYKAVGVYKRELFGIIIFESLCLGLVGTALGLFTGFFLSKNLIFLVSKSLNDLYFAMTVNSVEITLFSVFKAFGLGFLASFAAGFKPALDAVRMPCAFSLKRSFHEELILSKIPHFSFAGIICLVITIGFISLDTRNIFVGYFSFIPLIMGFTLLSPFAILFLVRALSFFKWSIFYKMGLNSIKESLSRTVLAITALALAVSASVGVGLTVKSFRHTVFSWLDQRLEADMFISAPGLISLRNDTPVNFYLVEEIKKINGIKRINYYREKEVFLNGKQTMVTGFKFHKEDMTRFKFIQKAHNNIWDDFLNGKGVLITETFAVKYKTNITDLIKIPFGDQIKQYPVLGIYTDYSSDQGRISLPYSEFSKVFQVKNLSGISLFLDNPNDFNLIKNKIISASRGEKLIINSNFDLKKNSMMIFDRTFSIAAVLQLISVIVAFTGIVSALMSLMLEKEKEIGILRAIGLHKEEVRKKVYAQTFFMGLIASILSFPLGYIFSWVLINVINKRAFGWSIDFVFSLDIVVQAMLVSIIGAVAAGIYPAFKMSGILPAIALREE